MESHKVFISYSHDSAEHKDRVFDLSERLIADGIDSQLDQYEISPLGGWPRWTRNQIKDADYVLVVCTQKYERRYEGVEDPGVGAGAKWEGAIITQQLYESEGGVHKFIPVVFTREDAKHIPVELQGSTYYFLDGDEGYERLYRHITAQPEAIKGALGKMRSLPPKKRKQDFSGGVTQTAAVADPDPRLELTASISSETLKEDPRRLGLDSGQGVLQDLKQIVSKNISKDYVTKLWTLVQLLLSMAGLVVAVYYGNALLLSLLNTHRGVALALTAPLEPTRNTHQGIAAFLLSDVSDDWAKPEHLNVSELNSILLDIHAKVQEEAARAKLKGVTERGGPPRRPPAIPEIVDNLNLRVINRSNSIESWQTAIASIRKESFMAVPATSLRHKTLDESPLEAGDRSRLVAVLEHNPEILFDLTLASELEPIMRRMDNASGERLTIIQTYFITESGVFLIRANGVKDQGRYYSDEFEPYTQHMDRPYFWGAVDIKPGQRKPTPFDYATKPYLDPGGNGFVVTFSRRFDLPNWRVGVLCVDAKLPDYVTDKMKEYMKSLGANVSDFHWSEDEGIEPNPLPSSFSWLNDQLNESREARSRVLGTIVTQPPPVSPSRFQGPAEGVVRFTVPIASSEYGDGIKRTRLLGVEIDSANIQKTLIKNLVFFTAGTILMIVALWGLFRDYSVRKRGMSNVLER